MAVVHCSAGIGRTGTVLLVLLLLDSLDLKDSIDPVEALARLRDSRARLVESFAQYSLALQILDEILFGASTTILLASLLEELPRLLLECPNQYRKLKALPSALTYKIAEQQNVFALTRNHAAYPSDTWRVCLAAQEGVHEAQYINAIRVTGLTNKEAFMVTEHPLASTSERFWRLVAEKCCPVVVFLNEFSDEVCCCYCCQLLLPPSPFPSFCYHAFLLGIIFIVVILKTINDSVERMKQILGLFSDNDVPFLITHKNIPKIYKIRSQKSCEEYIYQYNIEIIFYCATFARRNSQQCCQTKRRRGPSGSTEFVPTLSSPIPSSSSRPV